MNKILAVLGIVSLLTRPVLAGNETDALRYVALCEGEIARAADLLDAAKICKESTENIRVLVGESPLYVRNLITEANNKVALGNYPAAYDLYSLAADAADRLGDGQKVRALRIRQADVQVSRGKPFHAEILLRDALARLRKTKASRDQATEEADLLSRHAAVLTSLDQLPAAITEFQEAVGRLELAPKSARPVAMAVWSRYGEALERRDRYSDALEVYRRLVTLARLEPVDNQQLSYAYQQMGWMYEQLHNRSEAAAMYQKQLQVLKKLPDQQAITFEITRRLAVMGIEQTPG
ncbi:MAG: hypothetical protein C0434_00985 [Xanthomonadaceae bacterium]|nr:hypothetical protein [Xanthomonadaceae bacterium]